VNQLSIPALRTRRSLGASCGCSGDPPGFGRLRRGSTVRDGGRVAKGSNRPLLILDRRPRLWPNCNTGRHLFADTQRRARRPAYPKSPRICTLTALPTDLFFLLLLLLLVLCRSGAPSQPKPPLPCPGPPLGAAPRCDWPAPAQPAQRLLTSPSSRLLFFPSTSLVSGCLLSQSDCTAIATSSRLSLVVLAPLQTLSLCPL